jgi:hypothetical protein
VKNFYKRNQTAANTVGAVAALAAVFAGGRQMGFGAGAEFGVGALKQNKAIGKANHIRKKKGVWQHFLVGTRIPPPALTSYQRDFVKNQKKIVNEPNYLPS